MVISARVPASSNIGVHDAASLFPGLFWEVLELGREPTITARRSLGSSSLGLHVKALSVWELCGCWVTEAVEVLTVLALKRIPLWGVVGMLVVDGFPGFFDYLQHFIRS